MKLFVTCHCYLPNGCKSVFEPNKAGFVFHNGIYFFRRLDIKWIKVIISQSSEINLHCFICCQFSKISFKFAFLFVNLYQKKVEIQVKQVASKVFLPKRCDGLVFIISFRPCLQPCLIHEFTYLLIVIIILQTNLDL